MKPIEPIKEPPKPIKEEIKEPVQNIKPSQNLLDRPVTNLSRPKTQWFDDYKDLDDKPKTNRSNISESYSENFDEDFSVEDVDFKV